MNLARKLRHIFLPHESNNHKPRIFHPSGLLTLKVLLILVQIIIFFASRLPSPSILGYAANIAPSEVIRLTNEKRVQAGLQPLVENPTLSQAALAKGVDMINKNYWAHVAPDGTQPWTFFLNAGYSYRYAGENLARDFSNPSSAVDAWMASPTHKENLLSANYKEIGIGVVEGDMNGVDTTIIVQFFGTKYGDMISQPVALVGATEETPKVAAQKASSPSPSPVSTPEAFEVPQSLVSETEQPVSESSSNLSFISPFTTTKDASLAVVSTLMVVLTVDSVVISKKRIKRIGGRSFAHIAFLGMILSIVLILKAGEIL